MDTSRVRASLRERLGIDATIALVDLFNGVKAEWSSDVTERTVDRFERRLVEETSRLRVDMTQGFGAIRQEVGGLRQEISGVRQDVSTVRQEMALNRFELLKWTFVFWVGQVFAIASTVALLIRFMRPAL